MQIVGRWSITLNANDPLQYTNSITPAPYYQLDKLQDIDCPAGPAKCRAFVDVAQFPPYTRTRIRFKSGKTPGLFVWHW
jgi:hypothetical protein